MALTSSSTFAQITTEYRDTADYHTYPATSSSLALARRHVVACHYWLEHVPDEATKGSNSTRPNTSAVERSLDRALSYLKHAGATITHASFRELRRFG